MFGGNVVNAHIIIHPQDRNTLFSPDREGIWAASVTLRGSHPRNSKSISKIVEFAVPFSRHSMRYVSHPPISTIAKHAQFIIVVLVGIRISIVQPEVEILYESDVEYRAEPTCPRNGSKFNFSTFFWPMHEHILAAIVRLSIVLIAEIYFYSKNEFDGVKQPTLITWHMVRHSSLVGLWLCRWRSSVIEHISTPKIAEPLRISSTAALRIPLRRTEQGNPIYGTRYAYEGTP